MLIEEQNITILLVEDIFPVIFTAASITAFNLFFAISTEKTRKMAQRRRT